MPAAPARSFAEVSGTYGIGAWAASRSVVSYDPSRPTLLQRLGDALAPREFRARLMDALTGGRSFQEVVADVSKSRIAVVLRAYGTRVAHYFKDQGPVGRVAPARVAMPQATGEALSRATGRSVVRDRERIEDAVRRTEYRHVGAAADPEARSEEARQVMSALSDHKGWKTYCEWFPGMTAGIPARFVGLREVATKYADRQVFQVPGEEETVSLERGLHVVVARGYRRDGLPARNPAEGARTTFVGRRVASLPFREDGADRSAELAPVARSWGAALLSDFLASNAGRDAGNDPVAAAAKAGWPIQRDKAGEPVARMVYDPRGGNVLLPVAGLGFRDVGRSADLAPTRNSPDALEAKFGQPFDGYLEKTFGKRESVPLRPRDIPLRPDQEARAVQGFSPPFGEAWPDINPANTAIVFSDGSSRRFSLVHVATGRPLQGLPPLGVSNLPRGDYVRLRDDDLQAWRKTEPGARSPLRDLASGSVSVREGHVMTHLDSQGRPHNDFNGPSVVRAERSELGVEEAPTPLGWHHHGVSMSKGEFLDFRYKESLARNAVEEPEHPREVLENPFGLERKGPAPSRGPAFH